jgi:Zn-dependent peptidase ImmA (M78 family)/transcriptional regulator with XRE-family HTH domain
MAAAARVDVKPALLRWARERAGLSTDDLVRQFSRLPEWEAGTTQPTMRQLEKFASATTVPFGYLFLSEPPQETLPIPDFRTVGDRPIDRPSPNLLDTIFDMQRRQAWLREDRIEAGHDPLPFIGSITLEAGPESVAAEIRRTLSVVAGWADLHGTWTDALAFLRGRAETIGVIVLINGVVRNSTRRKLDPEEFRGFVLIDEYAPFVFLNGADAKAAQMFTLAHELAHLWIGQAGVFNLLGMQPAPVPVEQFCNAVAAEFLLPEQELRTAWSDVERSPQRFAALARRFKVSELVVARRVLDARLITRDAFFNFYNGYQEDERRRAVRQPSGGNFFATQNSRVGRVFTRAVARAVKEGRLLYRDAFELTGLYGTTFDRYVDIVERAAEE